MDLQEFVTKALSSILDGVSDARKAASGDGVCPDYSSFLAGGDMLYAASNDRIALPVKFDVAVTVSESSTKDAGGSLKVWSMGAEGKFGRENSSISVSRISFMIPVAFPRISEKKRVAALDYGKSGIV